MATKSRRKEPRYAARIPVRLIWDGRTYIGMTEDVSFQGMRIRSDAMPPLRLLVRVDFELPGSRRQLKMHAFVAHTTLDGACCQPSLGLELYGVSDEERQLWEQYVCDVRDAGASTRPQASAVLPAQLAADELEALPGLIERSGSVFCPTNLRFEVGAPVHLALTHPVTNRVHLLPGRVAKVMERTYRGVAVLLAPLDKQALLRLVLFLRPEGALAHLYRPAAEARAA